MIRKILWTMMTAILLPIFLFGCTEFGTVDQGRAIEFDIFAYSRHRLLCAGTCIDQSRTRKNGRDLRFLDYGADRH